MLALIGGTGLYELPGFEIEERVGADTPFGMPSGEVVRGHRMACSCCSCPGTVRATTCCRTR